MDIFCRIINGEIPSYTIYEDDIVKAFLDVNPKSIDLDTLNHIMKIAKKIKKLLEEKLNPKGIMLVQNNGSLQEVKHYHLHLIPDYEESNKIDVEEIAKKIGC